MVRCSALILLRSILWSGAEFAIGMRIPDGVIKQAEGKAVNFLEDRLLLVVARSLFDLATGAIAGAVSILSFLARLRDHRGIDDEDEFASTPDSLWPAAFASAAR